MNYTAEELQALADMPPDAPLSEAEIEEMARLDAMHHKGCWEL
jgi:hypothetical protein